MEKVIVVVLDATGRGPADGTGYDQAVARIGAEVAALEIQYARASAERHGRFQQRLESNRRELQETSIRLQRDISGLEQERDRLLRRLNEQLAASDAGARAAIEQNLARVQADYRVRIASLTRACELAESAIER